MTLCGSASLLKLKALSSSETSGSTRAAIRRHIPEDEIFKMQYVFCELRMARVVYISATFHSVTTQWLLCIPPAVTLMHSAFRSRGIFVFRMMKGKVYRGYRCTFPRVRRSGRGVDRSSPSSAEVKNEWSYTSTSLYTLMTCYGAIFTCPRRKGM